MQLIREPHYGIAANHDAEIAICTGARKVARQSNASGVKEAYKGGMYRRVAPLAPWAFEDRSSGVVLVVGDGKRGRGEEG